MAKEVFFEEELKKLINQFSLENQSNTPDFILANYIYTCLKIFNASIKERDKWYSFNPFDNFPESVKTIKL